TPANISAKKYKRRSLPANSKTNVPRRSLRLRSLKAVRINGGVMTVGLHGKTRPALCMLNPTESSRLRLQCLRTKKRVLILTYLILRTRCHIANVRSRLHMIQKVPAGIHGEFRINDFLRIEKISRAG